MCKAFYLYMLRIYWCDRGEELQAVDEEFEARVLSHLGATLQPYPEVAAALNVVPWAVLSACHRLLRRGFVLEGAGNERGWFKCSS